MAYTLVTNIKKFRGLSTDTKPTTNIPVDSTFEETDTSIKYVYDGSAWKEALLSELLSYSSSIPFLQWTYLTAINITKHKNITASISSACSSLMMVVQDYIGGSWIDRERRSLGKKAYEKIEKVTNTIRIGFMPVTDDAAMALEVKVYGEGG